MLNLVAIARDSDNLPSSRYYAAKSLASLKTSLKDEFIDEIFKDKKVFGQLDGQLLT